MRNPFQYGAELMASQIEAKPRNQASKDFCEKDEFKVADFMEGLRFVGGELHFEADCIRGRRIKTRIAVSANGTALLIATQQRIDETRMDQRFTAGDIRWMHQRWLGEIHEGWLLADYYCRAPGAARTINCDARRASRSCGAPFAGIIAL